MEEMTQGGTCDLFRRACNIRWVYIVNRGKHFVKMYFYSVLVITNMFHSYSQLSSGCWKEYQ